MFFQTLIFFSVCVLLLKMWSSKSVQQPPYLSGKLPIIGHVNQFFCNGIDMLKNLNRISEESLRKGGIMTLDFGFRKVYILSDPEVCLTVSNLCLEKEKIYDLTKPIFGNGLIVSSGPIWKKHRKLLNPAFSQPVLNSFMGTFNHQARVLVKLFAEELGKPFNHEKLLKLNNLETICRTTTGIDGDDNSDLREQYVSLFSQIMIIFTERLRRVWLHNNFLFNMTKLKRKQDEVIESMMKLSEKIIQMKRTEMRNREKISVENKSEKIKPFMELILDRANETGCFTDEEIREETDNIIAAGHDTSASNLTCVFTLLGSYSHIQDKVYNEIIRVVQNTDKDIDKDDLSKLIYTEAVIKETLRLYPIAPLIGRYLDKAVKLKKYTLKANNGCFIMVNGLNRHPMWGPDADQFRPERWLDTANLPDLSYFAGFGLGKRSCIGKAYAMMSMKITIAHVLRRYRISADVTKMVCKWGVTTKPVSGHDITLELRKGYE